MNYLTMVTNTAIPTQKTMLFTQPEVYTPTNAILQGKSIPLFSSQSGLEGSLLTVCQWNQQENNLRRVQKQASTTSCRSCQTPHPLTPPDQRKDCQTPSTQASLKVPTLQGSLRPKTTEAKNNISPITPTSHYSCPYQKAQETPSRTGPFT